MSNPFQLPDAYDASHIESKWYTFWEESGFFKANAHSPKPPYTIVIPPPNVTGVLHMGHALVDTLQDILIRWKRMSGFEALWVPGTDHAGIATQSVVERHLLASEKKRKSDYTREAFVNIVWEWKEKYEARILTQLKKMGCSCDWSRLRFTMDDDYNSSVRVIFKKLFDAGLIYRGDYLVNWDPVMQTALSDDEVEYEERESSLWTFKYPLTDGSGYVHIATTRPETMLGDTAVAISPQDDRYKHLVGKTVRLPILEREIPIIADRFVDPTFGTGMVKVTPAHDPNDYNMGKNHDLPFINILTPNGFINENGGPFQGLSREEARVAVVKKMQTLGLLEKIERHTLRVGVSYRSKAVIEPYLSKQWFVKMSPFVGKLKSIVQDGLVKILPPVWEQTYFHWISHLRDWCISRQLWWGHQIPIWYNKDDPSQMICYDGVGMPPEVALKPDLWIQDADVLDGWFSSALWPFATLGWPQKTEALHKFYPTSVLVTGHDILFFWVARMLVMGEYALGIAPFPETFLHGLIYGKSYWRENKEVGITYITGEEKREYDLGKPLPKGVESKWEKLSKSKGNVIDPLEMIDEYGTDAMRLTLAASANQTPQIDLDRRKFEEFKNFINKIWNGARFVFMNLEGLKAQALAQGLDLSLLDLEDKWILSGMNRINEKVNSALSQYSFGEASSAAYTFFWDEFCAYYVEISKPTLLGKRGSAEQKQNKQKILVHVLCNMIRLMHPIAPFITEELFQLLKERFPLEENTHAVDPYTQVTVQALRTPACIVAPYPTLICEPELPSEEHFSLMRAIVHSIRNIRGEMRIPPQIAVEVYLVGADPIVEKNLHIIAALVKTTKITCTKEPPALSFSATGTVQGITILIPLPTELAAAEKERLSKEREKLKLSLEKLRSQLANADFLEKAKPELIDKQRQILEKQEQEILTLNSKLEAL